MVYWTIPSHAGPLTLTVEKRVSSGQNFPQGDESMVESDSKNHFDKNMSLTWENITKCYIPPSKLT